MNCVLSASGREETTSLRCRREGAAYRLGAVLGEPPEHTAFVRAGHHRLLAVRFLAKKYGLCGALFLSNQDETSLGWSLELFFLYCLVP